MPQHDYLIDNQAGAGFRSDVNNALAAIVANNSGTTEPATMYAHMWWADTTANILKRRNAGNTAWISVMSLSLAISTFAETLLDDASASAMLTTLGFSAFVQTMLNDADAATARATLGAMANDSSSAFVVAAGTANAITADFTPDVTTLTNGLRVCARAAAANTTTTLTFQADATAAKTIVKAHNQALLVGDIPAVGYPMELKYDSTFDKWILLNPFYGESPSLGVGQTLQDMTASRAYGTTYTNTTGRTIAVYACGRSDVAATMSGSVNSATIVREGRGGNLNATVCLEVPPGGTYVADWNGGVKTLDSWWELR